MADKQLSATSGTHSQVPVGPRAGGGPSTSAPGASRSPDGDRHKATKANANVIR